MNWFLASVIVKSDLRKSQLNRRLHLPQNEYLDRSKKIQTNIVESKIFHEANLIACYLPIKNEVDTSYIIKSCFDLNKLIVLPKIISNSMIFTLHKVDDTFVLNKFGIKETDNEEISVNDIELFICPCLAYNKSGNRLGYGGGYYDKALSSSGAKKIGIAFELQKLPFDSEPHDIPMDYICNENGLFAC